MGITTQRCRSIFAALAFASAFGPALAQAGRHKLPAGDPCMVVSLAEVKKAFPDAKVDARDRHLQEYGSTQGAWSDSRGQAVFGVQESSGCNSAMEKAQGQATAFLDLLMSSSKSKVRYEKLSGIAPEALAFVESGDRKRGILEDGSLLVLRKGQQTLVLMSPELPERDRAAALKVYEDLGRSAAKRRD
jgi:hypothetical protein